MVLIFYVDPWIFENFEFFNTLLRVEISRIPPHFPSSPTPRGLRNSQSQHACGQKLSNYLVEL